MGEGITHIDEVLEIPLEYNVDNDILIHDILKPNDVNDVVEEYS